mgnify:CR=1 FL=1
MVYIILENELYITPKKVQIALLSVQVFAVVIEWSLFWK